MSKRIFPRRTGLRFRTERMAKLLGQPQQVRSSINDERAPLLSAPPMSPSSNPFSRYAVVCLHFGDRRAH